ncbi:hypothetical protein [Collimonas sp. PA-H2]|uniref:hypothetical protein n=1 Tax=Collimonas sp. PA-H2 TaxID=1881062 RepID=UPI001304256B|nr:hypothetical protein [Collimonas sp. PA-H2]
MSELAGLQGKALRPDLVKAVFAAKQAHQRGANKETGVRLVAVAANAYRNQEI